MKSIFGAAALLGGLAFATAAQATPIMYQFSATESGSSATGSFTFDAATDQASAISITIAGFGLGLDGLYTQAAAITPLSTTPIGTSAADIIVGISGAREAWIGFAAPLTPAGGTISVFGAGPPNDVSEEALSPTGSAIAVVGAPEPASFAVLGVGILGLVGLGLRRGELPATPPATRS